MEATIKEMRPDKTYFAVMLRHAPAFPDDGVVKPIDVQPLAVVAANNDNGGWGWVTLDEDEKSVVGDALLSFGAEVDVWHWCRLTTGSGPQKLRKALKGKQRGTAPSL